MCVQVQHRMFKLKLKRFSEYDKLYDFVFFSYSRAMFYVGIHRYLLLKLKCCFRAMIYLNLHNTILYLRTIFCFSNNITFFFFLYILFHHISSQQNINVQVWIRFHLYYISLKGTLSITTLLIFHQIRKKGNLTSILCAYLKYK